LGVFSRNLDNSIQSKEDLVGKRIGVQTDDASIGFAKKTIPRLQYIEIDSNDQLVQALATKKVDAIIGNPLLFSYYAKENQITNIGIIDFIPMNEEQQLRASLHIGIRKGMPILHALLVKAIKGLSSDDFQELEAKWTTLPGKEKRITIELSDEEKKWLNDHSVIRVSNEPDYAPFDFQKNGKPTGYSIDYVNMLAERLGVKIEFIQDTWANLLEKAKRREVDMLHSIFKSPKEREEYLNFTISYRQTLNAVITRKETIDISSLNDLAGRTVAMVTGDSSTNIIRERFPNIQEIEVDGYEAALKAVAFGRAEATLTELPIASYLIRSLALTNLKVAAEVMQLGERDQKYRLAVRKDWAELIPILEKAMNSITTDELVELDNRWLVLPEKGPMTQTAAPEVVSFSQAGFVIKMLAIVFTLILVSVFAFWFIRGRPKHLSIRETLFLVSFVFAALIVTIGTLFTLLTDGGKRQTIIENHRFDSYSLALELKQSSDDLTRFARTYAVTEDPKYETYFNMVSEIRDGLRPHPINYSQAFWDRVSAGTIDINDDGETYAIQDRLKELDLPAEESRKLLQAKKESDDLIYLEKVAMNAVKGKFQDADGNFTNLKDPDLILARTLLHSKKYHDAKSRISAPIDDFFILLEGRTTNELNWLRAWNNALLLGITILIGITIVFAVFVFFLLKRRILSPLHHLELSAIRVGQGKKDIVVNVEGKNEIGQLADAFNYMLSERDKAEKKLATREREFRMLVDNIPGLFWRVEHAPDWPVVYFSQGAKDLTGYTAEAYMEGRVKWIDRTHPEDLDRLVQVIEDSVEREEPFDITYRFIRADGEVRWIRGIGVYFAQEAGKTSLLDGYILDVHEQKIAEEKLHKAKEQAEAANRAKSIFLTNMSHEIRTPMNAILGYSQIMQHDDALTREQRKNLSIINRSGDHLLALINDVLEMSKIEAGRIEFEPNPFDLLALIKDLELMFRVRTDEKGLGFSIERNKDLPRFVMADEGKVRQVLINLLGNAVKFTSQGEVRLSAVSDQRSASAESFKDSDHRTSNSKHSTSNIHLKFEVADTGPGIPEDQQEAIFGAFEQAESSIMTEGGTGLGLAISRQYARMMGGDVSVRSDRGKGSLFRFEMLAAEAETAAVAAGTVEPRKIVRLKEEQSPPRILVVDDREDNVDILIKMLSRVGFYARPAYSGREAVNQFEHWKPHAVLMDIRMPVMDGIEATKRIRSIENARKLQDSEGVSGDVIIIAVSASALENQRNEIMQDGLADDFIGKPFKEAEILDALQKYLAVEYFYEEPVAEEKGILGESDVSITPDVIGKLPESLVSQLREATVNLDADRVLDLIEEVRSRDDLLAGRLGQLVEQFDFERLGKLLGSLP